MTYALKSLCGHRRCRTRHSPLQMCILLARCIHSILVSMSNFDQNVQREDGHACTGGLGDRDHWSLVGSVPLAAVLSTPAACYSAGGSSDHFAHKVEHGVHSTNECVSTAMCQAASGFTFKGVLNHCALSRAHNLLNGMPSSELGRNALALTKLLELGIALKGDGESRRTRCVRTLTAESETYMYTCYYQIWYTTLQYTS